MTYVHTIRKMAQWFALADADVVLYAAKVTVWGRWFIWVVAVILAAYRPGFWYPETSNTCPYPCCWGRSTALCTTGS